MYFKERLSTKFHNVSQHKVDGLGVTVIGFCCYSGAKRGRMDYGGSGWGAGGGYGGGWSSMGAGAGFGRGRGGMVSMQQVFVHNLT